MASSDAPLDIFDGGLKPPADVVIPPKNVREQVAKTADFVVRKGPNFEDDLRGRTADNAKFAWLKEDDPYNAYYEWYKQQLREGKGRTAAGGRGAQGAQDNKPKGPVKPAEPRFSARMPNIAAKDFEILKLTALYTARNGENWLKELRSRESGNFQFDFLRVNHTYFQFFRALVEQYRILLDEENTQQARIAELQENIKNRFHILDRAKQRAEYEKFVEQQKEKETKRVEDEKKEYLSIDWQDFTVIATVTFDEADDAAELPAPTSLNDLQSASLEQKAQISLTNRQIEEAAPDDQTYYNVSSHHNPNIPVYPSVPAPMAPAVQPVYQPQPISVPAPPQDYRTPAQKARDEEEERALRERQAERERAARVQAAARSGPGAMRIRHDYVPGAAAKKANVPKAICPNCKQEVPTDELDEHIRIELLDPKWKEQRQKADARYSSTMHTVDVASNLKRFASQRDDVFDGVTGAPITPEEADRRKRAALSYDGQPDPVKDAARVQQMQNMNVQEQIRRIQEKNRK
ncbi:Pre-mRNA splicing factor PRP21 like protein-domain-containing protein [Dendryphion nanum]|uniref:Pre-mRNA splicing factor PRP21 like protein-domain-containing protein n=1 Tax=Dendryphion nanum TaxID=256645 RepID=A0A9P9IGI4_9PLEO|nr:Pre-mRNA splicing factor PRP21 like protein-domain-containing protein [Dendryphion nanum]